MQSSSRFPVPRLIQSLYIFGVVGALAVSTLATIASYLNSPSSIYTQSAFEGDYYGGTGGWTLPFRVLLTVLAYSLFAAVYILQSKSYGRLWRIFISSVSLLAFFSLYALYAYLQARYVIPVISDNFVIPIVLAVVVCVSVWGIERIRNRLLAARLLSLLVVILPYVSIAWLPLMSYSYGYG